MDFLASVMGVIIGLSIFQVVKMLIVKFFYKKNRGRGASHNTPL